jgi:hypothetical protein
VPRHMRHSMWTAWFQTIHGTQCWMRLPPSFVGIKDYLTEMFRCIKQLPSLSERSNNHFKQLVTELKTCLIVRTGVTRFPTDLSKRWLHCIERHKQIGFAKSPWTFCAENIWIVSLFMKAFRMGVYDLSRSKPTSEHVTLKAILG